MPEMKTLTIGDVTYEVVDEAVRERLVNLFGDDVVVYFEEQEVEVDDYRAYLSNIPQLETGKFYNITVDGVTYYAELIDDKLMGSNYATLEGLGLFEQVFTFDDPDNPVYSGTTLITFEDPPESAIISLSEIGESRTAIVEDVVIEMNNGYTATGPDILIPGDIYIITVDGQESFVVAADQDGEMCNIGFGDIDACYVYATQRFNISTMNGGETVSIYHLTATTKTLDEKYIPYTTEEWTFELADGSTVTKRVVLG